MAYLNIPTESGKVRPSGRLEIDYASGLAQGLRHFFVCDGKGMTDIVSGRRFAATGGSQGFSRYGPAWVSAGSGTYIVGPTGKEAEAVGNYRNGSGVTAFVAGEFSTGNVAACGISCSYFAGNGGWGIKTELYPDTNQVGYTARAVEDVTSGIATPTGPSIISIRMAQTGTNYYRVNDLAVTTSTNADPIVTGDTIAVGMSRGDGAYEDDLPSGDKVYWGAIYNQDVSEGLRQVLHTRPFGTLVRQSANKVYFIPAAVAGGWKPSWAYRPNHIIGSGAI